MAIWDVTTKTSPPLLHLGSSLHLSPMAHPGIPGPRPVFVDMGLSPGKIPAEFICGSIWTQQTLSHTLLWSWPTDSPGPQDLGKVRGEALPL